MYVEIHEDSEHRATMRAGCAADFFTSSDMRLSAFKRLGGSFVLRRDDDFDGHIHVRVQMHSNFVRADFAQRPLR